MAVRNRTMCGAVDKIAIHHQLFNVKKVTIYTDGACLGNPGPGGWAATLEYCGVHKDFSGGELATTNNRMELQAAIEALRKLKEACEVQLYTDSEYLRDGITTWIHVWKASGWRKKVKNKDLWLQLDEAAGKHEITWHWVRGHSGTEGNERCDMLSLEAAQKIEASHTRQQRDEALNQFLKNGLPFATVRADVGSPAVWNGPTD